MIIITLAVFIIGAGIIYYIDTRQDQSLSLGDITAGSAMPHTSEADTVRNENQSMVQSVSSEALLPVRPVDETDHIWGNLNAPVQIVSYIDFECPFCLQFTDTIREIEQNYTAGQVVIAVRHFPLRSHPNAVGAALAAECASEQGKFWEMYDRLFVDNKNATLGSEQYLSDAETIGLNTSQFSSCLESQKYLDRIENDLNEARSFGITGTPGNFVNGIPHPGAVPFEDYTDSQGIGREGMQSFINTLLNDK